MESCTKKDFLSNTTPIKYLSTRGLEYLASVCSVRHLARHEYLYTVKDTQDKSSYILCNGSINITDDAGKSSYSMKTDTEMQ